MFVLCLCQQAYSENASGYLHGQPVYTGHQQGVVVQQGGTVTTIVTSQTVQQVTHTLLFCSQTDKMLPFFRPLGGNSIHEDVKDSKEDKSLVSCSPIM